MSERGSRTRPASASPQPSEDRITRKLGDDLAQHQAEIVRDVIISRGGSGANVQETGPWANQSLRAAAIGALQGSKQAEKAVKIVKQARRLGERY